MNDQTPPIKKDGSLIEDHFDRADAEGGQAGPQQPGVYVGGVAVPVDPPAPLPGELPEAHRGSWVAESFGRFFDRFLQEPKNRRLYESWQEGETEKQRVCEQFNCLNEALASLTQSATLLKTKIQGYANVDMARTIFSAVKGGSLPIEGICNQLATPVILKQYGAEVAKFADADVAKAEKELARFVSENKALLKELKLI
jgi:hypothetical protein